jgi:hypothetical protein
MLCFLTILALTAVIVYQNRRVLEPALVWIKARLGRSR